MGNSLKQDNLMEMDESDINAFTIKPDALIYFTIAQIVGIIPKGLAQGKMLEEVLTMKCLLVDDLEDLCEAQGYLRPDLFDENGEPKDDYYKEIKKLEKELRLNELSGSDYWLQKSKLARLKFKLLNKRVFGSAARWKELEF